MTMRANRIEILQGDITKVEVDVIINAASHSLLGYDGVSGAILRAGGRGLEEECAKLKGCREGEAKITKAHGLSARHIIHTVGPVWFGGYDGEESKLARCYECCFALIKRHRHRTVAIPSIATGGHAFPLPRAARLALRQISLFLATNRTVERILIVCFDRKTFNCYERVKMRLEKESIGQRSIAK